MKDGNWVALDKNLAHFLPRKRPYTILEAMFSFSKDMNEDKENSINGYSRIWSWSRCKVRRFVEDLKTGARHEPDRNETGTRQEVRIINNNLQDVKDRGKTGARQGQDRGKTTTINLNPNPNKKTCVFVQEEFESFWLVCPSRAKRCGRDGAEKSWRKHVNGNAREVIEAMRNHAMCKDWLKEQGQYIPMATSWLNQKKWTVEVEVEVEAWKII